MPYRTAEEKAKALKAWKAANPDKVKAHKRATYERHRERILAQQKDVYAADPGTRKAAARQKYKENRETLKARSNGRYHANREQILDAERERRYGLAPGEHRARYEAQGGLCAICTEPRPFRGRQGLHVDHCHATGRVRGLLCSHCNVMLGRARDRPEVLLAGAEYLKAP